MPLITLTTDYGTSNHDAASLKGQLYKHCKDITITDITHDIKPFDTISTAYVVKEMFKNYPEGTFHLVGVNAREGNDRLLLIEIYSQYLLVPDNGLVTLIFAEENYDAYVVGKLAESNLNELFIKAINQHAAGLAPKNNLTPTTDFYRMNPLQAVETGNMLRAAIFYIDGFDNAVVNVTKDHFERFVGENRFSIQFRSYHIEKISAHYSAVADGDFLCRFNDAGFLEIAINRGRAASLLGLNYGSMVLVERL